MLFERSRRQADHSLCGAMITDNGVAFTVVQHQCGSTYDGVLLCAITLSGEKRHILPRMYCIVLPNNQQSTNCGSNLESIFSISFSLWLVRRGKRCVNQPTAKRSEAREEELVNYTAIMNWNTAKSEIEVNRFFYHLLWVEVWAIGPSRSLNSKNVCHI